MASIETLFVTRIYRHELAGTGSRRLLADIERACQNLAGEDLAGQRWCADNHYPGYTSYASLTDLPERFPEFGDLVTMLESHVSAFALELQLDLGGKPLTLDSLWVNVLPEGGFHTAHIHPHSVISGTFYVAVPKGASAIRFEDPRLGLMMAAPPRKPRAARDGRTFVTVEPRPGTVLLWESWLRHEVPVNRAAGDRISVSFNYRWGA
jgi:uncharacterized protein (TIGR02466 family)